MKQYKEKYNTKWICEKESLMMSQAKHRAKMSYWNYKYKGWDIVFKLDTFFFFTFIFMFFFGKYITEDECKCDIL